MGVAGLSGGLMLLIFGLLIGSISITRRAADYDYLTVQIAAVVLACLVWLLLGVAEGDDGDLLFALRFASISVVTGVVAIAGLPFLIRRRPTSVAATAAGLVLLGVATLWLSASTYGCLTSSI